MKRILGPVFLVFILSNVAGAQTVACDYNVSPCEAYAKADAVFVGKVTGIAPETVKIWQRDSDYDQRANVVIEKVYKGIPRKRVVLHQLGRRNAPKFVLNGRYLFYANLDPITKNWEVKPCGRTRMADYVQDDQHYLSALPSAADKTRIAGELVRYDTDEENPAGNTKRLAGVKIRIIGEGKQYQVVTDANGVYEVYDIPSGRYLLDPEIPNGLTLMGVMHYGPFDRSKFKDLSIELKQGQCSGATILLMTDQSSKKSSIGN